MNKLKGLHVRPASAFNGAGSSGVRCPWRFANLNNTGNAGLAAENGSNAPSNANWNSRPRLILENKFNLSMCNSIHFGKIGYSQVGLVDRLQGYALIAFRFERLAIQNKLSIGESYAL